MPQLADVAFLYDNRASQDFQPNNAGLAYQIKQIAFRRQAQTLLVQLPDKPHDVLDFGCGSGQFTRCLGDVMLDGSVTGSDFHRDAPADLADRPYVAMANLPEHTDRFDLVLAMHVLEHDDDALGLCQRIAAMARKDGLVVLEVPNVDCCWAGIFGADWDAWYLPYHRSHFSATSLKALAENAGLEILALHPVCVPTMGRSLANMLKMRSGLVFLLAGIALHPLQWLGEKLTSRPSAWRLIARRR
ncbi:MAG: hypothetical protein RLY97_720 [Pseudomonadota bacterium]